MPDDLLAGLRATLAPHNGHARDPDVIKARFGLGDGKRRLSPRQWGRVNDAISSWRKQVLASAARMPTHAYEQGHGQTVRFLRLLGAKEHATPAPDRATAQWLQWILDHELTGTLDRYTDEIRSAVLYGLENQNNPTAVASALYAATEKADRDWRLVAQTEMARANVMGRLAGCRDMGYGEVWVPPHTGACAACKRLIENQVFAVDVLEQASHENWGRKQSEWVPALPQHPRCRHTAVPWVPEVYEEAQQEYAYMRETGLTDEALAEMFDSSGQLRPQYADDPRLAAYKTPEQVLSNVVAKVRSTGHISKGFFDPPQVGLDPLIWEGERLKTDVRDAIVRFWTGVLGDGWQSWAKVFITGSATSYQWGTGWQHPWLGSHQLQTFPDVDSHLVIDYSAVRAARPMWAGMSPMELRKLLESWAKKAKADIEVAPGLRLDAYIRMEETENEFERDVSRAGQGVWDVIRERWVVEPSEPLAGEYLGRRLLGGVGGRLAHENPDWIKQADDAATQLQLLLDTYQAQPGPESLQALQNFMDVLYEDRTAAFLQGSGQEDRGNWAWQYLEVFGPLLDVKELLAQMGA
jgi:hypothetical protein